VRFVVLSGDDILDLLDAVADRLEESLSGEPSTVVVVGGSFMALHGLRAGTADVDTITRIDDRLRGVVEEVAAERDLRPDWLNDRSAAFEPGGRMATQVHSPPRGANRLRVPVEHPAGRGTTCNRPNDQPWVGTDRADQGRSRYQVP
jgi:hypothetical protein